MVETGIEKSCRIVQFEIQSNDCAHIVLSKVIEVGFGRMAWITIVDFRTIVWPAEGNKFIWYNPIQVSVLNSLVILVFDCIEIVEIEEAGISCLVHSLQTVHQADCIT